MKVEMWDPEQNPFENHLIELFEVAGIRGAATAILANIVVTATAEAILEQDPGQQLKAWFAAVEREIRHRTR